ncbi:MAG: hypothetical protein IT343_05930 [Candidatus Melainabacteria bacterium]|jgi:hypothetical protein|nr:hypothetical protein [Candidatus Melainabacteria bacterium]
MSTENGAWRSSEQQACPQTSAECNFKPDYELSTPRAQQWAADSQVQRSKPLDINENGEYRVKWGDSLSTIAERALRGAGAPVSKDSLQSMQDAIVEANRDRYKSLECNRDFIKEDWSLRIPGLKQAEPPVTPEPPVRVEPRPEPLPEPMPEPPRRPPCPPERDIVRPDYRDYPPPAMDFPGTINNYGELNIFLNGRRPNFQRDFYQFNGDVDQGRYYRPLPYRPDYDYHQQEPRGCSPCEQRQFHHNRRMPQELRRNPVYPRY